MSSGPAKKKPASFTLSRTTGHRPATSSFPSFSTPDINATSTLPTRPIRAYPTNLTPLSSMLRPHCAARDRLALWKPASERSFNDSEGQLISLPDEYIERVQQVLIHGYANSTRETYASGLLSFHVFCDSRQIPEEQRAPCSSDLLLAWISTMAGTYAGTSVKNYVHGIRAWHIIHGIEWRIDKDALDTMITGAERLQPERSRRKKRLPFTTEYIEKIIEDLDPSFPLDAACKGCLTTAFYCAARVGELTVPNLRDFSPQKHVTTQQLRMGTDCNGFHCRIIHLPVTKSSPMDGEDIYFSAQLGATNPDDALNHHLILNKPETDEHLFTYSITTGGRSMRRPLTKSAFIARIQRAAKNKGLTTLQGHGIRIGATLEYLLRGIPFDAVKVIGRWKSDAFLIYLRRHAEIMAPYMQPQLAQELIRYTTPPVRCECAPTFWGNHGRWMRRALLQFGYRS
ncbi:hypothetical protein C8R42DRAFT_576356 [Lentinula raphanica]|nr:hypothetical protein C8R42DRAFT_576356 [Lentinula raphanica]